MSILERLTDHHIHLTSSSLLASPSHSATHIPHGDYSELTSAANRRAKSVPMSMSNDLLFLGLIRPYKNVPDLLDAFRGAPEDTTLRIVGESQSDALSAAIQRAAAEDNRISLSLSRASDQDLIRHLDESRLVVLPFSEFGNSGSALLALSASRPVLIPRTAASEELQQEVGDQWVHLFDGRLTSDHLTSALSHLPAEGAQPRFVGRDWQSVAEKHIDAYLAAIDSAPGSRRHGA
ncbi:glycosyltransferase [Microbacterium aureliae]